MEVAIVLRLLWRRRRRVAAGAIVAVALGVAIGRSPIPASGIAKTSVIIDTPQSELVASAPQGDDTLYWRATLLATLLGTDTARHQMANEVHVPAAQIAVTDVPLTAPTVPASLPVAAVQAATEGAEQYALTVNTDNVMPIVSIATSAPDRAGAARLARAAVIALQDGASTQTTPAVQGLSIRQISPVVAHEIPGGSGRMKMALMAVVIFVLWCFGLTIGPLVAGATRTMRETRALEA